MRACSTTQTNANTQLALCAEKAFHTTSGHVTGRKLRVIVFFSYGVSSKVSFYALFVILKYSCESKYSELIPVSRDVPKF
jgi:hypothetical protein